MPNNKRRVAIDGGRSRDEATKKGQENARNTNRADQCSLGNGMAETKTHIKDKREVCGRVCSLSFNPLYNSYNSDLTSL